jgi:hypothetical protein
MGAACRLQSYTYFKFAELSTILHTTEIIMTKRGYIYHAVLLTALAAFVLDTVHQGVELSAKKSALRRRQIMEERVSSTKLSQRLKLYCHFDMRLFRCTG